MRLYKPGFGPNEEVNKVLHKLDGKGLIAEVLSNGTRDGRAYEIMPYYPHGSVADYDFRGKDLDIIHIVVKTAMALDAIHKVHIIHKDIKPANLLVTDESSWDTVICDFGIADITSGGKVVTKQTRTPIYAAPELYDPKNVVARLDGQDLFEITHAADFYSLGMTILCLWYGEKAFLRKEKELAVAKLKGGIKAPDDMPDTLTPFVEGLLQTDPKKRWSYKDIKKMLVPEALGDYGMKLFLNPLCDMRLNSDMDSPDYLATGQQMGRFLNEVYLWEFTGAKAPADEKLCDLILESFVEYEDSYLQTYFDSKGDFFSKYSEWVKKCVDEDDYFEGGKTAPSDPHQRYQMCIMKVIKGLGFEPYYTFGDTGETITDIEGLKKVRADKKQALEEGGLRGWIAVHYQENPFTDFSEKMSYEYELLNYIEILMDCDPDVDEGDYYAHACNVQAETETRVKRVIRGKVIQQWLQRILSLIPLVVSVPVVKSFVDMAKVNPAAGTGIFEHMWIFLVIGALAGLLLWLISSRFLVGLVSFGIAWIGSIFITKLATDQMMWVMAVLAAATGIFALIIFILTLKKDADAISPSDVYLDDTESVLECLDYTFNEDDDFDSSLNGFLTDGRLDRWNGHLKKNRKRIIICFCCLALAIAANIFLSPPTTNNTTPDETVEEVQ
ncbi:MAG: protein kinase [Bacteroidaceae bacterium]|nr:protein kinase [Bacteroidaceae bacterium]